jgi:paraquat-inducible protein B
MADKTLQAATAMLHSANTLVAEGSESRDDLEATLRDLAASASTLRDLSRALERDPSLVLRGRGSR